MQPCKKVFKYKVLAFFFADVRNQTNKKLGSVAMQNLYETPYELFLCLIDQDNSSSQRVSLKYHWFLD